MLFLANKNQFLVKHGIFLELIRWEFLSSSFSETRKQDDFNKALEESEIFTCLIFDRIGRYTREEFEKAYQNYKEGKNPKKFYLYFKTLPKGKKEVAFEVYEFRKIIEKEEQIYREYNNPDQLKVFLNQNLDNDLPEILKEALLENIYGPEPKTMTQFIPDNVLDNLDDADRLLSRNLTEEALKIYSDVLRQVNKHTHPETYGRVLSGSAMCHFNRSDYLDQEINLQKAQFMYEESLELLDPVKQKREYLDALEQLSQIHINLSFIRNKIPNLHQAIELAEKITHSPYAELFQEIVSVSYYRIANCYEDLMRSETNTGYLDIIQQNYDKALKLINPETSGAKFYHILSAYGGSFINAQIFFSDTDKRLEMLQKGIDTCRKVLDNHSPDEDLINYSSTLSHMSHAYSYRGKILNSFEDYLKALEYSKKEVTILKNFTHHAHFLTGLSNQCIILMSLFNITNDKQYLDDSKENCQIALQTITMESHPHRYARFHANIGLNFLTEAKLYKEEPSHQIDLFHQALEEFTISSVILTKANSLFDFKWLQHYRAKCYYQLGELENKEYNWKQGIEIIDEIIACYDEKTPRDSIYNVVTDLKNKMITPV